MKIKYVFYILLLAVCAFIPFDQSYTEISILYTTPCVQLGAWTVGQSSGNYGNTTRPINVSSFITNSEETCCVSISVNYCPDQPSQINIMYPITKFEYELSMTHGFTLQKKVYSVSGPDASLFDPSTSFSVSAKFTGPPDTESLAHPQNGRNNEPMKVTVKFIGYYGSDPNNQKIVNIPLTWTQDSKDMLRQEYVDMTPPDSRAELPVPSKDSFVPTISSNGNDRWNRGHYGYMIDDGLKSKKSSWLAEVNKYRTANSLSQIADTEFIVNSAYRNPYHQRFHVNAPYTASFHSRHCYGDALDVHTIDVDGDNAGVDVNGDGEIDKYIEQVYNNESKSDDADLLEELCGQPLGSIIARIRMRIGRCVHQMVAIGLRRQAPSILRRVA